jgi:hypothetical protein
LLDAERRYHEAMSEAASAIGLHTASVTVEFPGNPKWMFDIATRLGDNVSRDELSWEVRYALLQAIDAINRQLP